MEIAPYNKNWQKMFLAEKEIILNNVQDEIIEVQHIGSTAVPDLAAKPIIDIAILVPSIENADTYIKQLEKLDYIYQPERSSVERYFFTKNDPPTFHLSLAQPDKYSFWERQKLFRDYLISHPATAKEYEELKKSLIKEHPDGRQEYCDGKSEFINNVLKLAGISTD